MKVIVEQDGKGNVLRTTELDLDAGTATITDGGQVTVAPIEPTELESLRATDREQRQLDRLQTKFDEVKAAPRLTVADYRQDAGPVDMREAIRMINDLRSMVLDLTRLVRGMAAEEGDN